MKRKFPLVGFLSIFIFTLPISTQAFHPLDNVAVLAKNSVKIENAQNADTKVVGDVIVNFPSAYPTLTPGFDLDVSKDITIEGSIYAKSIRLDKNTRITLPGDVFVDNLALSTNAGFSGVQSEYPNPVEDDFPIFQYSDVENANVPVNVPSGVFDLLPGKYLSVTVGEGATLRLVGPGPLGECDDSDKVYHITSFTSGANTSIVYTCPVDVRVQGRLFVGKNSSIKAEEGSELDGSAAIFYVGGENDPADDPLSNIAAVVIDKDSIADANIFAENGTIKFNKSIDSSGMLIAKDVWLNGPFTAKSAFVNRPPVADPKTVFTNGEESLEIELTASDPDGDELSFSIVSDPPNPPNLTNLTNGTLGPVKENTEFFPGDPVGCTPTIDCIRDPRDILLRVTVTYTPDTANNLPDSFTFQAEDPKGAVGQAVVLINPTEDPNDPNQNPPPVDTVIAFDKEVATAKNTTITIKLTADAPCDPTGAENPDLPCDGIGEDVPLTFSILSGPAHGTLSEASLGGGVPTPGEEVPQRTAAVVYTPDIDFLSPPDDSFVFEACGTIGGASVCDQGTVTINVIEPQAVAIPQQVTTPAGEPVLITLSGIPGLPGTETRTLSARAAFLDPAEIAGSVSDTDGDGNGDASDNLPGPAPELMAVGIGPNSGATSFQTFDNANDFDAALGGAAKLVEDFENREINDNLKGQPDNEILSGVVVDTNMANLEVFGCSGDKAMFGFDRAGLPTASAAYELTLTGDYNAVSFVIDSWDPGTGPVKVEITFRDKSTELIQLTNPNSSESDPVFFGVISDGQFIDKIVVTEAPETSGTGNEEVCLDEITVVDTGTAIAGVKRIQMEWDITSLEGFADSIVSADVILHTEKGASDSLDTFFFVGTANQDGQLTNSDFEAPADPINGVVMSVPNVPDGTTGTFSFDVLSLLQAALLENDTTHFSIQGRVDESSSSFGNGLQVRTTATGNDVAFITPQLSITTPPVVAPPLTFYITSLPSSGTLWDGTTQITVPRMLSGNTLTYKPESTFTGFVTFGFKVDDGFTTDTALVTVVVESGFGFGDCEVDEVYCDKGR